MHLTSATVRRVCDDREPMKRAARVIPNMYGMKSVCSVLADVFSSRYPPMAGLHLLQTKDKASVKWDLVWTWTKLAGAVSDIVWKQPLFFVNRRFIKGAGGGQGAARWLTSAVCSCEPETGKVYVYTPHSGHDPPPPAPYVSLSTWVVWHVL